MLAFAGFQAQLASIMDILAKAAVAEISKIIEDGCAVWKLEISRHEKENEALKRKLQVMQRELRASRLRSREKERLQESLVCSRSLRDESVVTEEDVPGISLMKTEDDAPSTLQETWKVPFESTMQSSLHYPAGSSISANMQCPCEEHKPQAETVDQHSQQVCMLEHSHREASPKTEPDSKMETKWVEPDGQGLSAVWAKHTGRDGRVSETSMGERGESHHAPLSASMEDYLVDETEKQKSGPPREQATLWTCVAGSVPASGRKQVTCVHCGKNFPYLSYLKRHLRTHTGEKPYSCAQCGKKFSDGSSRRKHERTHTGKKPFHCLLCGKPFSRRCHLTRHEKIHASEVQR